MRWARPAFTLVELLVVFSLISVLAALLMPTLQAARAKGRAATCVNNLHQVGVAMGTYAAAYDDWIPQVLTAGDVLRHIEDPRVLKCPSDDRGAWVSYGLNGNVVMAVRRFGRIQKPAQTPLAFDSRHPVAYYYSDLDFRHTGPDAMVLYADSHVEPQYREFSLAFRSAVPLPGPGYDVRESDTAGGTPPPPPPPPPRPDPTHLITLKVKRHEWDRLAFRLTEDGTQVASQQIARTGSCGCERLVNFGAYFLKPREHTYRLHIVATAASGRIHVYVYASVNGGKFERIAALRERSPAADYDMTPMLLNATPFRHDEGT